MTAEIVSATALSHVALRVREVARSIAWYREVLGYEVLTDGPARGARWD
jgi:catechol 2,3-dioxygenase-like lactoylglutathione lyase family enzyme